ncbi:uracil-DNA glycosylase [endosymbiont 'TC1' of Trimyema compressum]|uniref:uracil-DNA glycosylase n=1 Tax=endosymbiont 'TC1' of Trimyema compressum TaxID=243899 RepID=UPI0007F0C410|nr:uracil-DNA glycosylase [endosymbiont 'TC1' of Trimyema compressum]AMP21319.1 uracil-DNA glycosylase [endosymbiont 'TC1' of Trimyema compressum]
MLDEIKELCAQCQNCCLGETRNNIVFGIGNPKAKVMFIGEGPGENENLEGEPFVGEAGKLLDKILEAVSIKREDVYITNIIKCRPPKNRTPKEDEVEACREFVEAEIALVNPEIIVALGGTASQFFLGKEGKITKVRGHWFKEQGIDLICTFHPAALLRDPGKKRPVWEDFKKIQERLEEIRKR